MGFSGTSDIVVCPESTLNIVLCIKYKVVAICLISTIFYIILHKIKVGELGVYDKVSRSARHSIVWSENTLDIAVLLKPKMVAICAIQTIIVIIYRQNRSRFGVYHSVFGHDRFVIFTSPWRRRTPPPLIGRSAPFEKKSQQCNVYCTF